jgi:acyl-coenzyme A synthetase/AMP-(fatty) acid ligase
LLDTVTCQEPSALQQRLAAIRAHKAASVLISSPAQLTRFPDWLPLPQLQPAPRLIFSSGGPLPAATAVLYFEQLGGAPIEIFGSTETGGIAWRQQEALPNPDDPLSTSDAWMPLPGISVTRDEDDGALLLQSPFLQTDEWLRMDDAVALLPDGRFKLKGRLDRTVKIEEKRLSLPEMEGVLMRHPWVQAAALVVLGAASGDTSARHILGAVLVLTQAGRTQWAQLPPHARTQTLRRYLAEHFDAVLLPRRWRIVDALPFNERSKLPPAALKVLFDAAS